MSEDLMITQQDLIDWIDRSPSNDDLDLATFISTRLEKFYDLEHQLQQKENKEIERLNNIINELEAELYAKYHEYKDSESEELYAKAQEDKEILDYIKELKGSDKE